MSNDLANFGDNAVASVIRGAGSSDSFGIEGRFDAVCYDEHGNIKWEDYIENQVVQAGKILMFSQLLITSPIALVGPFMGLITSNGTSVASNALVANTTYIITSVGGATFPGSSSATVGVVFTATGAGTAGGTATQIGTFSAIDTMASHAGWVESSAYQSGVRASITFSTPTGDNVATSGGNTVTAATTPTTASFTANGIATIGGCFIVLGTGAVNTISNGSGTLWSAGAFSAGPKSVTNNDVLQVTYTTTAKS